MNSPLLARTVVQTLIASGVREVVLSPGSRNAGLSLALATAHEAGLLRLHVRVDERTAGFLALGLAKASEQVVALVTTSGTAVANLHPAVAEARHSGIPLLVLSADRPLSLRDSGANQTTRQHGMLAPQVLDCLEVADESGTPQVWARQVVRAVALARGVRTRQPGPVQINLGLAAPLIDPLLMSAEWLAEQEVGAHSVEVVAARPGEPTMIAPGPRTVVVAGDATPTTGREARSFAEALGVPLLAEPSSNARKGRCAVTNPTALLAGDLAPMIERVIVFGHPTLSRPMTRLLSRTDVEMIMVADRAEWIDPGWAVTRVVDAVAAAAPGEGGDTAWLREWLDHPDNHAPQSGGAWNSDTVTGHVLASLNGDDVLVVGSSQAIRCADRAPVLTDPPTVYANRGLAGIDGTLSTALGVRLATERTTTVLLGDLTFLHDLGALVCGDHELNPAVTAVVIDDHGGGIFAGLEQGDDVYARHFQRVFGTPQRTDLADAARGLGADAVVVTTTAELDEALAAPRQAEGWRVIIARV